MGTGTGIYGTSTGDDLSMNSGPILPRAKTGGRVRACGDVCMSRDVCVCLYVFSPPKVPCSCTRGRCLANVFGAR
jgi:hypothetical protein